MREVEVLAFECFAKENIKFRLSSTIRDKFTVMLRWNMAPNRFSTCFEISRAFCSRDFVRGTLLVRVYILSLAFVLW